MQRLYPDDATYNVRLKVEKKALPDIAVGKYIFGLYEEEIQGDYAIQHYSTYSLDHFARWFLSFADKAEIVEPVELKEIVRGILLGIKI